MRSLLTLFSYILLFHGWAQTVQLTADERAWVEEHPKITFGGDPTWEPYLVDAGNGSFSGLDVDILERIEQMTGLTIEVVGGQWPDMVRQGQERKIDGLVTSSPRPSRRQYFNFTDEYAVANVLMYSRTSDTTSFRRLQDFDGRKLGLQAGNQINHDLLEGFDNPDVRDYPNIEALVEALLSEEVDYVMSGGELTYYLSRYGLSGVKTSYVLREVRVPLVYSIRKDWPELVSILNKALAEISEEERRQMLGKWLLDRMPGNDLFSPDAAAWLQSKDTLSIGLLRDWPPLSMDEDGVADGLIPGYYREINEYLGLQLDLQFYDLRQEMEDALAKGQLDAVVFGTQDSVARGTVSFYSFPLALVSSSIPYTLDIATLRHLKIGIGERNPFRTQLVDTYPSLDFVAVSSLRQGILRVEQGELDGFFGGLPLISYHLQQYDLTELKISGILPLKYNLRAYSNDPVLVDILNKAHVLLPAERVQQLTASWSGDDTKASLIDYRWFWRILGGFLVLLLVVFAWNRSLMEQIKKRKRIERTLRSNRANLKAVIENSAALICSFDQEFRVMALNNHFARLIEGLTGNRPSVGESIDDFMTEEFASVWKRRLAKALSGETYSRTYSVHLEGLRYFEASFSPIVSSDEVEGISCHAVEVTELTKLSRYFVNVLDNMRDYAYLKDHELKYIAASQSFAVLHGFDHWRDLIGKTDQDIYPKDLAAQHQSQERQVLESGIGQHDLEENYLYSTGEACWLTTSKQPIRNSDGEVIGLMGMSHDITERRKIEQELLQSKAGLTALIESTTSRIYSVDLDLRLVDFNQNFFHLMKEMTGVEVQKGHNLIDLIPDVWKELWRKRYNKALEGTTYDVTDRDKVMDVNRYFQTFFNPIRVNGEIVGVSCFAQDVTEMTRLNQVMVGLLRHSSDFVYVKDLQHRFLAASDSLALAHGLDSPDELLGKTDFDIHPEELAQGYYDKEVRLLADGEDMINFEDQYIDKDGSKWVESNKRPLRDSHGDIVGLIGITRDVTDRKRMETELRQTRDAAEEANVLKSQYIRELKRKQKELLILNWFADSAPVGLSMADLESEEIVFVNPALLSLLEETREKDVIGKSIREYRDDKDLKLFDKEIKPQIEKDKTWMGERRVKTSRGKTLWTFEHYFILKDEEGEPIALANVVTDITHRRKMESDLREKKKEADRANRAKSAFLANMSHEIRTPLNSIIGFADLLNQMVADDLHQSYLQAIASGGKTLLALINDVLDISKIESGRFEIRQVPLNLKVLAEEMRSMFSIKAREKHLEFEVSVDNPISEYLLLDELRIKQLLINLLGNSFKFTNEGGVYLQIRVMEGTDKTYSLEFEITDTGIGISPEAQDKVFQNFYQDLDRPGGDVAGGTGLGLAIVQKLVALMGGTIEMESVLDRGTTFRLRFPKTEIIEDTTDLQEELAPSQDETLDFEQASVLLVDDVDNNRFYLRELFRHTPIRVWEAQDGLEALDVIGGEQIDLILTDIRMPRMDGFELVRNLRQSEVSGTIPIVAVTASVFGTDSNLKDLFDAILYKPVLKSDLFHLLKRFVPHRAMSEATYPVPASDNGLSISETLKEKLREQLWPAYAGLREHQPIAQVLAFAKALQDLEIAQEDTSPLRDFGNRLESTVNNLDIASMLDQLRAFEKLIELADATEQ